MEKTPKYVVREDTAVEGDSLDPEDWKNVKCWSVTRVTPGGTGWHIGKYRSEHVAEEVADFLRSRASHEIP